MSIKEQLENSEKSLSNIEEEVGSLESRIQELEQQVSQIESSKTEISNRGDNEVANSLEQNLATKKQELDNERNQAQKLMEQLEDIKQTIDDAMQLNEASRGEVETLASSGEDVSAALGIIDDRENDIQSQKEIYEQLRKRISDTSNG